MKMSGSGRLFFSLVLLTTPMILGTASASQDSTAQATEPPAVTAPPAAIETPGATETPAATEKPAATETAAPSPAPAAPAPTKVRPGDKVYIQPGDFGMALTAAILKKKVPVTVLDDSTKADFWIQTVSSESKEKTAVRIVKILSLGAAAGSGRHFQATVTTKNRDGVVVFAYNSQKENFQSAAQNVAKNLKKHIEKP